MTMPDRLITILDDNDEDRATVRRYLAEGHPEFRFLEYDSYDQAEASFAIAPPDCLLMDYRLNDLDGLEALERITRGSGIAPFPIVILTGRGSEAIAVRALKRGALDYLVKGHDSPAELRSTVADAIARFARGPADERRRAESERVNRDVQQSGHERLVLVVDDCPEDREAVRRALGRSYRLIEESSGAEALAACRSAGIDALVLDYSLPDMDGLEFLHELTQGSGITPFPVLMMTGRGDEAVAVQALKRGASDYLVKGRLMAQTLRPVLEQAIERVADRRVREQQRVRVLERLEAEARRRADQLAEADRRKDEFLAMLAHELRNPLAPVSTALHVLRHLGPLPEEAHDVLDVASQQVRHLARLVDDLMEVSRINRGRITLQTATMDLVAAVRQAVETARPAINAQRHRLEVSLPNHPIPLFADATRLDQILANLLNNAVKYTDPEGQISVAVGVEASGASAFVRVTDSGVGIDAETLPRIFDLFAQADRSLDRARGGLGIGLTLVRALAELHGGSITAASDGPGTGSTFTLRLPVAPVASAVRSGPSETAQRRDLSPLRILLVDDNEGGTRTLTMLLERWGHEVHAAHDGVAGLEAARALRPDVVLLDIGLPRMNGYELARAIRQDLADSPPLLAAVTGYAQPDDRRRAEEAGCDHHLGKPVNPDELRRLLETAPARSSSG
jgi:CheY-like chemotaxis protein